MMMIKNIILFIAFFSLCAIAQAQSQADINKAKAYYFQAEEAIEAEEWNKALQLVDKAENLSGQNGAPLEAVRVKAWFGKKEYVKAKAALSTFFTMGASPNLTKEMSEYLLKVDELIQKEKERVAREEEAARFKKEKLEGIDVLAVAFETGKNIRAAIKRSINNANLFGQRFPHKVYYTTRSGGKRVYGYLTIRDEYTVNSESDFYYRLTIDCKTNTDGGWGFGSVKVYPTVYFSVNSIRISSAKDGVSVPDCRMSYPGATYQVQKRFLREDPMRAKFKQTTANISGDFKSAITMRYNLRKNEKLAFEKDPEAFKAKVMEVLKAKDEYALNNIIKSKWEGLYEKADKLDDQKKYKEAIKIYTKVIRLNPAYGYAYSNRAYSKRQIQDYKGALEDLDKAISIEPSYWRYREKGYNYYYGLKDYKKAIEAFKKAVTFAESNTDKSQGHHWIAFCYGLLEQWNAAYRHYDLAIEYKPEANGALYDYASALFQNSHQLEKASQLIGKAVKIKSSDPNYLFLSARIYVQRNRWANAFIIYDQLLKIKPNNTDYLNSYAYNLALAEQNLDKAEKMILKALKSEPENNYYLDTAGWVYYKKGDYKKAQSYIQKAIDTGKATAIQYEHMGDITAKTSRPAEAKTYWQKSCVMGDETACKKAGQ